MNRTYSEHTQYLPRIRSQGKFARATTHHTEKPKEEEPNRSEEKRVLTRLSSERKTLQSANVSKAVRYEATNAICLKKIEVLEKQAFLLDKEITAVNQDISDLRLKKRATDDSKSVVSKFSQVSKRSKLGGEANGSRLDALRKKVDKESERNKQMQADVDKVRREINTTKRLNEQLVIDLKSITEKLDCEARNALKLDEEIASKRQELKRKKIDLIHQKTHLIKNYDVILKKLDEDLTGNPISESRGINTNLYLTDVYLGTKQRKKTKEYTENSPRAKRNTAQLAHFKEKIGQCEQHFQQLKQATGCNTIQEAIGKFSDEYEENFSNYRFINERFSHLEELKQKNTELNKKKEDLEDTLAICKTSRSACDLLRAQERLAEVAAQKQSIKAKIEGCQNLFFTLKTFVSSALNKLPLENLKAKFEIDKFTDIDSLVTRDNLQEFLDEILAIKQSTKKNRKQSSLGRQSINHSLQEYLEHARKESGHDKQRFFGREELMQLGRKLGKPKHMRN